MSAETVVAQAARIDDLTAENDLLRSDLASAHQRADAAEERATVLYIECGQLQTRVDDLEAELSRSEDRRL